jgi:hypothetical protein
MRLLFGVKLTPWLGYVFRTPPDRGNRNPERLGDSAPTVTFGASPHYFVTPEDSGGPAEHLAAGLRAAETRCRAFPDQFALCQCRSA